VDLKDIVAIVLGLWGAGLSTFLAVREVRKDRRKVVLELDIGVDQSLYFRATNTGHRPIAIASIDIKYLSTTTWELIRESQLYEMVNEQEILPAVLAEGQNVSIELPEGVLALLSRADVTTIKLIATDVEGKSYSQDVYGRPLVYKRALRWLNKKRSGPIDPSS
jgi:hypothetical protein